MRPIYDNILKYIKSNPTRFHMPGHFGNDKEDDLYLSAPFDITELDFSDNLQNPQGIILDSENLVANDFGAKRCFYFTSGATTAILTALGSVRDFGNEIIIERGCHKSVYSALSFFNYTPHYIFQDFIGDMRKMITANDVEKAIEKTPNARCVVITSPDYFGRCVDIYKIKKVCEKYNKLLIVDSAHGAHFAYSTHFPLLPTKVADLTVVSFHKTLPVYSGGASLFCNNDSLLLKINHLRSVLHTTSPTYLTLCSIDYATDKYRQNGQTLYHDLFLKIENLKQKLPNIEFLKNDDFTRLVLKIGQQGFDILSKNNIVPEMTYNEYAVLIVSPQNVDNLSLLYNALKDFKYQKNESKNYYNITPVFDKNYTFLNNTLCEYVDLENAVNRTANCELGIYPPGVPIVARGEIITPQIADILKDNNVFGFVNNKICVTIK